MNCHFIMCCLANARTFLDGLDRCVLDVARDAAQQLTDARHLAQVLRHRHHLTAELQHLHFLLALFLGFLKRSLALLVRLPHFVVTHVHHVLDIQSKKTT